MASTEGIDPSGVDHGEGQTAPILHHLTHGDLPKSPIARHAGEIVCRYVAIGRIGIPEFVVLVEGDVDFDDGAVGVPRDREVLRLDVGGILDREPQPVVERQIPRDREDEVGGGGERGGAATARVWGEVKREEYLVTSFRTSEDAGGAGLGGAAAEELDAAEPDAEDAVELAPAARRRPLEHGADGGAAAE
ncbi:hypothetical protein ACMD2_19776, partial [Ananas comosus]